MKASTALGRCVAIDAGAFATSHWDAAPLVSRAGDLPADFSDLFAATAVDELLVDRGLRQPFFRLVKSGEPVSGTAKRAVAGSRTITDLADPDAIRTAYAGGATIVLNSLHRVWPPIGEFCRALSAEIGHPTQCNAYVTPPGHQQGFAFHHDTHDVFVLQIEGSKRWLVHRPVIELPTKSQPRSGADLVSEGAEPLIDTVLHAGDALYLPRGYVHAAATTDENSIHLTIGVQVITWLDVLRDIVNEYGPQDLGLRHALPMGPDGPAPDIASGFAKQLGDWVASLPVSDIHDRMVTRQRQAAASEPVGILAAAAAADRLGPDDPIRPRQGPALRVLRRGERVAIEGSGLRVELPAIAERMVRAALAGPATPRRLVADDPDCDLDDAMVVVRRLLREALLVPAP